MSSEVVLDIETQNTFDEVGGHFVDKLKVSLVGVYSYETETYESYLEHELPQLFSHLERSGRIIGYNTLGFDMPVLNQYYAGDLLRLPQLDLLKVIEASVGFRLKLDSVAQSTVGVKKSGHGLQAVQWWKEGKIDAIREYCLQDVKVTKAVYEFGLNHGYVLYDDRQGVRQAVPVDFKVRLPTATVNLTLGV